MLNKSFKQIADSLMKANITPKLVFVEMQIGTGEKFTAVTLNDIDGNLRYFRIMPDGMVAPIISISKDVEMWPTNSDSTPTPTSDVGNFGYEPGEDVKTCKGCGEIFTGSRDAYRCAVCAGEAEYEDKNK